MPQRSGPSSSQSIPLIWKIDWESINKKSSYDFYTWKTDFQNIIDDLIPNFYDDRTLEDETPSKYTIAGLLEELEEERIIPDHFHNGEWFAQQYRILNKLIYLYNTNVQGTIYHDYDESNFTYKGEAERTGFYYAPGGAVINILILLHLSMIN